MMQYELALVVVCVIIRCKNIAVECGEIVGTLVKCLLLAHLQSHGIYSSPRSRHKAYGFRPFCTVGPSRSDCEVTSL